jgi:poly(3-hydroxybutyrate) depolymerase
VLSVASIPLLSSTAIGKDAAPASTEEIVFRDALAIGQVGRQGRSAVRQDAVEAMIVAGTWKAPSAGDEVALPDGSKKAWQAITVGDDGAFSDQSLRNGYAYVSVTTDVRKAMLLDASGHNMVYVNGQARTGDRYSAGWMRVPVLLEPGDNEFLFHCGRGRLAAKLVTPKSAVSFDATDLTLPDIIVGEPDAPLGAIVVTNATGATLDALDIRASMGEAEPLTSRIPTIPPMAGRKIGFRIPPPTEASGETVDVNLELIDGGSNVLDRAHLAVRIRRPDQSHKRTFISAIDGSVQYYAVQPAQPLPGQSRPPALVLTLHGAGVEAQGQAEAYSPKTWGHVVAATNRRPFGFDWEDWGRLDAIEVLDLATAALRPDPSRVYLTGHSMGGHGVWQVGAHFPDRFAAIAPSAGWSSFWSYASASRPEDDGGISGILRRAGMASDTLALSDNYRHHGVYILHGAADDNVPPKEAHNMREHLAAFHHDLVYHEQPDAGHWWDVSDEPGTDCVDWAPMFDFFARHAIPFDDAVRQVAFTTVNPGISGKCHWVTVEAQVKQMSPSLVDLRYDPGMRRFFGATSNVARLSLDVGHVPTGSPVVIELDGQKLAEPPRPRAGRCICLARLEDQWHIVSPASAEMKGPHRYGPFKDAFRRHMVFVYATKGRPEENAWALAKARFDAEMFRYIGNGSVDVVPDTAFDAGAEPDRNIIVYGNADTHATWETLLGKSPVQVRRDHVSIGECVLTGDDLTCLFVRPRPGSATACVGVVAGTGQRGLRLADRTPIFVSGAAFPDCLVIGAEMLEKGIDGIRAAGFFGLDWSVEAGDFAWKK